MNESIVYLIDDEPELLELLSDVTEMANLNPKSFTRANQFFDEVTSIPDNSILVLDLHMPEMDGIEVMRRLATVDNAPALILISGHDSGVLHSAEKLGKAHNLEIIASLNKPVMLDQFQLLLEQYSTNLGSNRLRRDMVDQFIITDADLYNAIRNREFVLHYQPQVNILTESIVGVEALVRWQHPDYGLIYPDRFIPLAEENGWIGELTHHVIDIAVQQEQVWQDQGFSVAVSVNISAADITTLTLPEQLAELLADNLLDPTRLTLEVTESVLMGELVTSLDILTRLRLKGVGLSIDDFGTGYSSLSQLHRVPFTELKIDRSFVANMTSDDEARAIVKTCIILGHELNMLVVAEGVEDKETWNLLRELGCDIAQGYLISKPIPPTELMAWRDQWKNKGH